MTDWIVGSSILIVMIFAIRKVFGMRISSRFRYALWAVVMIRLLCPVTLWNNQQLVHNITEVSRQMFQNTSGTKVDKVDSNAELGMENGQNAGVGDASNTDRTKNDYTGNVKNQNVNMGQQNEQEINQTENLKITLGHNVFNQTGKETTAQQPEENSQSKDSNSNIFHSIIAQLISIAPAIWLYGSIAAGCWFAIVNMRFYHMLMRSRKQIDSSRKLLVYQVSGLSSPCLFGIIHPAIYLKEETKLKDDQILMILQHEICHYQHKDHIWSVMSMCIDRGLNAKGCLPGPLKVKRRANELYEKLLNSPLKVADDPLQVIDWINAYAFAVSEENAAGGRVVTAPTNGAAGVIPAVINYYRQFIPQANKEGIRTFLLVAGAIGALYKKNASISGADVGCQGEVGVACAMAAAAACQLFGGSPSQIEYAAEMALEHHLGMTCDPVCGLVQIPCIERNAFAATRALDANLYASFSDGKHRVSFDRVVEVLKRTGHDIPSLYKETSEGGLAQSFETDF